MRLRERQLGQWSGKEKSVEEGGGAETVPGEGAADGVKEITVSGKAADAVIERSTEWKRKGGLE